MNNDSIISWITSHPQNYPGKHQGSQPRTDPSVKPLDSKAQFHLVVKGLGEYIRQNLLAGRGVNYKGFGAFAFQVETQLVKPAQLSNFDITKELSGQREQRMHNHGIRPCFAPDKRLEEILLRYPGKEELEKPKSQHSIYQKGFNMIYCNPVPIAASCSLDRDVADACLTTFARAVCDLAELGKNLEIVIGVITIKINNRNLTYTYNSGFKKALNDTEYQKTLKKSLKQTKDHWEETYDKKWQNSTLSSMVKKPDPQKISTYYEKGLALKIMSLDLNSTQKTK